LSNNPIGGAQQQTVQSLARLSTHLGFFTVVVLKSITTSGWGTELQRHCHQHANLSAQTLTESKSLTSTTGTSAYVNKNNIRADFSVLCRLIVPLITALPLIGLSLIVVRLCQVQPSIRQPLSLCFHNPLIFRQKHQREFCPSCIGKDHFRNLNHDLRYSHIANIDIKL